MGVVAGNGSLLLLLDFGSGELKVLVDVWKLKFGFVGWFGDSQWTHECSWFFCVCLIQDTMEEIEIRVCGCCDWTCQCEQCNKWQTLNSWQN